jgi:hypothetical protein
VTSCGVHDGFDSVDDPDCSHEGLDFCDMPEVFIGRRKNSFGLKKRFKVTYFPDNFAIFVRISQFRLDSNPG